MRRKLCSFKQFDVQMLKNGYIEVMTSDGPAYVAKGGAGIAADYLGFLFDDEDHDDFLSVAIIYEKRTEPKPGDLLFREVIFYGDTATFDVSSGDLEPTGDFAEIRITHDPESKSKYFYFREFGSISGRYSNASVSIFSNGRQIDNSENNKCFFNLEKVVHAHEAIFIYYNIYYSPVPRNYYATMAFLSF